jgi:hypothetical protein
MSKNFRHHKKSSKRMLKTRKQKIITRNIKLKSRKLKSRKLKSRKRKLKGGNGLKCSICEKMVDLKDTFVPRECLMKHGKAAHRICEDCWWDEKTGFALETSSHECPGCKKSLPLTPVKKEDPIVVDLTED